MKNKFIYLFILSFSLVFTISCTAYRDIGYLKNVSEWSKQSVLFDSSINKELTINTGDCLYINLHSSIEGADISFNTANIENKNLNTKPLNEYTVDNNGNIYFPVVGKINLKGKTIEEIRNLIFNVVYPKYYNIKPYVDIRLVNFKVSVLGEVSKPGIYNSENAKMTILDALAAAGDMTIYGKRKNVLLIRTEQDGTVKSYRINMQDKNSLANNDVFYLKQNDKIYVEPNKTKGNSSAIGSAESIWFNIVSTLISIATFVRLTTK